MYIHLLSRLAFSVACALREENMIHIYTYKTKRAVSALCKVEIRVFGDSGISRHINTQNTVKQNHWLNSLSLTSFCYLVRFKYLHDDCYSRTLLQRMVLSDT